MSFVGKTLGFGGGGGSRPIAAPLIQPVSESQTNSAYMTGNIQAMNQQQALLNALQAQGGLGNQSSVFNQGQALANQLQGIASGNGPNPALAQLQNTTGQNVANQAALMASQRGTGQNAGLLARQAGMQGANIQQQAVGQGAALRAQQQLAGINALQNQQGFLGNLANNQVANQIGGVNAFTGAAQNEQNLLNSAANNYNANSVSSTNSQNNANAQAANNSANLQSGLLGGAIGGIGTAGTALLSGGAATPIASAVTGSGGPSLGNFSSQLGSSPGAAPSFGFLAHGGMINGPQSFTGRYLKGGSVPGKAQVMGNSLKNDHVKAMLSPGEIVLPRSVTKSGDPAGNAAKFVAAILAKKGMTK